MNETIIDRTYVCLKLIDMLYKKGLINEATYFDVKRTYQNKQFFCAGLSRMSAQCPYHCRLKIF